MYSAAFNSFGHLSGSPDAKTGTFSSLRTFGMLQADAGLGPAINLSIAFSPLSTMSGNRTGLGSGWSFKLASYSKSAQILTLNSGESYKVLSAISSPWKMSHKVQDIHVKQEGSEIRIYHKNGDLEVLEVDPDYGDAYISSYVSASGRFLKFNYFQEYGYNRLTKVSDSSSTLATVAYNDNEFTATVTIYPKTSEQKQFILNIHSSGLLYKLQLPEDQNVEFEYEVIPFSDEQGSVTLYLINKITYPNGATEQAEYEEKLYLPPGAPIPYLPAVSKHTKCIGNSQPPITTLFEYEKNPDGSPGNNYWGYNSNITWQDNYDNLFDYPAKYNYFSQTTCGTAVTKSVFNKFHQVLSKVETNGSAVHQKITTYNHYSINDSPLSKQPITYELIKDKSVQYVTPAGASKVLTHSFKYDDYGNITSKVDPTGVATVYKYYPSDGGKGCPPHVFGLVAFPQQKTVLSSDGSESKTYNYTYQSIANVTNPYIVSACVVPSTKTYLDTCNSYTYFDESFPEVQCSVKSQEMMIGKKTTTKSHSFSFMADGVSISTTLTGHDGAVTSSSQTHSIWSGLTLQHVDNAGVATDYTYDINGLLKSQTITGSSGLELLAKFTYTDNPASVSGVPQIGTCVVKETNSGIVKHTYYNGEHHELSVYEQDEHGLLRKISEKGYDEQGRVKLETEFDYEISKTDHSIQKMYSKCLSHTYGFWDEVKETQNSEGIIEMTSFDHVNMKITKQLVRRDDASHPEQLTASLAQTVTTLDLFGHPIEIERIDKSGGIYSTTSYAYDGFGRKIRVSPPLGSTMLITKYDGYDRPINIKYPDGTVGTSSYVDFSPSTLVSSIAIKDPSHDYIVGQQEYDGLMRVTTCRVNGVETKFSYDEGQKMPSRKLNGRGQTILFQYIPELGDEPTRIGFFSGDVPAGEWNDETKVSENVYKYAGNDSSHTGHIISSSGPNGTYSYEYTTTGLTKKVFQSTGNHSKEITNNKMTLLGKPLSVSIGARQLSLEYDVYGQPVTCIDSNIKAETTYDLFGRIANISTKQFNGETFDLLQSTEISYDEFSREAMRVVSVKNKEVLCTKSFYDAADKLVKRETAVNRHEFLTETFKYDERNRLEIYDATNYTSEILLPCNEYGKPFVSQKFTFDGLNNITTIETTFPQNSESNTATFLYDRTNKQQLKQIQNSLTTGKNAYPPTICISYDVDGNMVSMNETKMTYSISGHMSSKDGNTYSYDPYERLVKTNETIRFYSGTTVVQEVDVVNNKVTDFIHDANIPIAEIQNGQNKFYGVDGKSSVVLVTDDDSTKFTTYAPYGTGDNGVRMGLNGQLKDATGDNTYPLGNGTRSFWPAIAGFSVVDTFSPFLGGGLNPYRYCSCDPINATDPSGHIAIWQIVVDSIGLLAAVAALVAAPFTGGSSLMIGLGILSATLGVISSSLQIASDVEAEEGHMSIANKLSIASLSFGIASIVTGVAQAGADVADVYSVAKLAKSEVRNMEDYGIEHLDFDHEMDNVFKSRYRIKYGIALRKSEATESESEGIEMLDMSEERQSLRPQPRKKTFPIYSKRTKVPMKREDFMIGRTFRPFMSTLSKRSFFAVNIPKYLPKIQAIVSGSKTIHEKIGDDGNKSGVKVNTISVYGIPPNSHLNW